MKKLILNIIHPAILILGVVLTLAIFGGCMSVDPLYTTVKIKDPESGATYKYKSPKDLTVVRTEQDANGSPFESLRIEANASDPNDALGQREEIEAQRINNALQSIIESANGALESTPIK